MANQVTFFAVVLFIICFLQPSLARIGNCTGTQKFTVRTGNSEHEIDGLRITTYPLANGVRVPGLYAALSIENFVERNRSTTLVGGVAAPPKCVHPTKEFDFEQFAITFPDSLEPFNSSRKCTGEATSPYYACGEIALVIPREELDCWLENRTEIWNGKLRRSIYLYYSHPDYPDFDIKISAHAINESFLYSPPVTSSVGFPLEYRYSADYLKLGFDFSGWPWSGYPGSSSFNSDSSFFVINFNLTVDLPGGVGISTYTENQITYVNFTSMEEDHVAIFVVDRGFVVDSTSFNRERSREEYMYPYLSTAESSEAKFIFSIDFCDTDIKHWDESFYDPSMGFLLTGDAVKASKKSGTSTTTTTVAIAVTVPIVVLLIAYVIIVTTIPASRPYIFPGRWATRLGTDATWTTNKTNTVSPTQSAPESNQPVHTTTKDAAATWKSPIKPSN